MISDLWYYYLIVLGCCGIPYNTVNLINVCVLTSVEEVTAEMMGKARELKLEVEPDDATELLQSHDKIVTDEELLLLYEQKWFLEMETTPGEDGVKVVEQNI